MLLVEIKATYATKGGVNEQVIGLLYTKKKQSTGGWLLLTKIKIK